jgi:DNA-binding transcriptional LysR family regulator
MRPNEIAELIGFAAIAEQKSFRRAAERLNLTPSTLSHSLRALEERLGVRLLNRTTRSVALTEAGMALLEQIRPALQQIAGAVAQVNGSSAEPRGTVRINVPHLAAELVLGKRLGEFARTYPSVVLDIAANDAFVDVIGQGYDAGIRLGESIDRDMVAVRVTDELRNIVVGAPAYFAAHPAPLAAPEDLHAHHCIGYRASGSRTLYKWEFEQGERMVQVPPRGPLVLDSHALLVRATLAGAGLAYVVESAVQEELADGRLTRVLDDWCQPFPGFFLYYPSQRQMSSGLRALIDFVRLPATAGRAGG